MVNTTQHSSDWLIVPTTANQITGIEKPNYHKTLIFFPTTSLKRSHEARIDELADSNEPANIPSEGTSLVTLVSRLEESCAALEIRSCAVQTKIHGPRDA